MAKPNANTLAHLEWLGFVKPTGLVVSPPALDKGPLADGETPATFRYPAHEYQIG